MLLIVHRLGWVVAGLVVSCAAISISLLLVLYLTQDHWSIFADAGDYRKYVYFSILIAVAFAVAGPGAFVALCLEAFDVRNWRTYAAIWTLAAIAVELPVGIGFAPALIASVLGIVGGCVQWFFAIRLPGINLTDLRNLRTNRRQAAFIGSVLLAISASLFLSQEMRTDLPVLNYVRGQLTTQ
jgi:hypothetical protein